MARVIHTERALSDLVRLTDFLVENEPAAVLETVELITEAVQILENHPLIGRSAVQGLKELVISRGKSGYIALYSYELVQDTVLVLSVRHPREARFVPE